MGIVLTDEQEKLIKDACKFVRSGNDQVFQYTAPAGAGKSTVMHAIIEALGLKDDQVAPMAYTGAAAIVMRLNGFPSATTIHSSLYKPYMETKIDPDTGNTYKVPRFKFVPLDTNRYKLIVIDEASMVPYSMLKDLLANNIPIIAAGDLNQLPPVKDHPAFLYSGTIHYLTKIMRQNKNSAIVEVSRMLSKGIQPKPGNYGDLLVIYNRELNEQMIKSVDTIICGTNKTREFFNVNIRKEILHTQSPLPLYGEKVVCRQNDWEIYEDGINLANGLAGKVASHPSISGFDNGSFIMDFIPDLFPNIRFTDLYCDYKYFTADYKKRKEMKANFMGNRNTINSQKFEFSYAITTHISQGNQFLSGIYIQEYLNPSIQNNLNYTGITRFRNYCIYVLPDERFMIPAKISVVSINGNPII